MHRAVTVLLSLVVIATYAHASEPVVLGALVEYEGAPAVRAAFRSIDGHWESLGSKRTESISPILPPISLWPIDQRKGRPPVRVTDAYSSTKISAASLYQVAPPVPAELLSRAIEVPAWAEPTRVLAMTSRPLRAAPLAKRTASLLDTEKNAVRSAFLGTPPVASWCQGSRRCELGEAEVIQAVSFEPDIKLVAVRFKQSAQQCDDETAHCSALWFALRSPTSIQPLYQAAREATDWGFSLTPLSAADFDGDAQVEYLFWLDAYNENGFVLSTNGFRDQLVFSHGYH